MLSKVKLSKSLCSVSVKRGRIVLGGGATPRVARRRSGPSSSKFVAKRIGLVLAHLERRPAPRNGRSLPMRPMSPCFRPRRAAHAANGPLQTWGHWPHGQGSAVSRRRAPLEMCKDQTYSFRDEFRRGRPATPTRAAGSPTDRLPRLTLTEHRDFCLGS